MQAVNSQVLDTVRDALSAELDSAVKQVGEFGHICTEERSLELREHFLRVKGAFSMLNMGGAEHLCAEMADVCTGLAGGDTDIAAAEQLQAGTRVLTNYFDYVANGGCDSALILLADINRLRKINGKPALTEVNALAGLLPEQRIVNSASEPNDELKAVFRQAHQLYQKGLLHLIRNQARTAALRVMFHSAGLLARGCPDQESLYWQLVAAVVKAMATGQLSVPVERVKMLMGLERQLAAMVKGNIEPLRCYPQLLEQGMLACLSLLDIQTEETLVLCEKLGVEAQILTDRELQSLRAKLDPDSDGNAAGNLLSLEGYTSELRLILDEMASQGDTISIADSQLPKLLRNVAEITESLGLTVASEKFSEYQHAKFESITDREFILSLADSVMYLECVLLILGGHIPSAQQLAAINANTIEQTIENNIVLHAEKQVLREAINSLESVMQSVTDFCDGAADEGIFKEQAEKFDVVFGASKALHLDRAAEIARQCKLIFSGEQATADVSKEALLEAAADAIVSLSFYLESRSRSSQPEESVLGIAEEAVHAMKA